MPVWYHVLMFLIANYVFASVLLVSIVSLAGVALLSLNKKILKAAMIPLVSFSTGAILGNVFFDLFPEIAESSSDLPASFMAVLAGILVSFIIEKFIHWRHCHDLECSSPVHPAGVLVLIGDASHNFLDGVLIAASYSAGVSVGIATTAAVMLHEIPQEFGDFAVLLHSGFGKRKALFLNFVSALTALVGAGAAMAASGLSEEIEAVLLPFAAGNFLYIAGSDLIPSLHKENKIKSSMIQLAFIFAGIVLVRAIAG